MSSDKIIVREDTFKIIKDAVNEMVDIIKPTYGPASNKVIIDKFTHRLVVDDGVQIARDFESNDPKINAVVRIIKEVLIKTNDLAGDGTTGAAIMLQAIINEVGRKSKFNGRQIELSLKKGLEEAKKQLRESAVKIESKEDIKRVALVAFDDEDIAEKIANLYVKIGKDGIITVDRSETMETVEETTDGIVLKSGYISPYMVTDAQRMQTEIENPYILITDYRVTETKDLMPIMNEMAGKGLNNLIVIAENVEQKALATMIVNLPHVMNPETKKLGTFMSVAVALPKVNDRKTFIEDLALMTGATLFTDSMGNSIDKAKVEDLGRAKKIIIKREETVIVEAGGDKEVVDQSVDALKKAIENEVNADKKKGISERLARLNNTLAVIKVGASTENEQKALKFKIEDAVNAVKLAYQNGVVCGAGLALSRVVTSSVILNEALKYPSRQLMENVGNDNSVVLEENQALNVVSGQIGNFLEVGVMDPVDVLIAGVESAVSIASLLITSSGMVIEAPKEEK